MAAARMSPALLLSSALDLAERGLLPDAAIRAGIRGLLDRQRTDWRRLSPDERASRIDRLVAEMRIAPIAPVPARANDEHHEVPLDFFRLVLGPHLKYSCGLWGEGCDRLEDAERSALEITAERAGLDEGARILELGCGWGSLSLWVAEHRPTARILAVSNSRPQREFIEARARERGLSNLSVVTADVNTFDPRARFDRVVSVEMFEHLRNYEAMFRRVAGWLEPNGSLFLHVFCHREMPYVFSAEGPEDWMGRHFFTEGLMPSERLFDRFADDLEAVEHWRWSGDHYRRTAEAWLANLDAHRGEVLAILRGRFPAGTERRSFGRWRLFFLACAELFGARGGSEWFVSHQRLTPTSAAARRGMTERVFPFFGCAANLGSITPPEGIESGEPR